MTKILKASLEVRNTRSLTFRLVTTTQGLALERKVDAFETKETDQLCKLQKLEDLPNRILSA